MNRRNLFKTGIALAGGSMLASVTRGEERKQDNEKDRITN